MTDKATRRALAREYKETPRPMGVYRVRNTIDGRDLVGSSVDVPAMLNRHRAQLRMRSHRNGRLQADWDARGEEAFVFEVLDLLEPSEEPGHDPVADLEALEALWLEKLAPFGDRGYSPAPKS